MTLREIHPGAPDYEAALRLREKVLRAPLGLSFTDTELADESNCFHLGGFDGGRLIAILLLKHVDVSTAKMRQVAVAPDVQGSGIGSELVAYAESFARERGYARMVAHARCTATGFYLRNGYSTSGGQFIETTIPHILVSKDL